MPEFASNWTREGACLTAPGAQPIETAPKGEEVLVWDPDLGWRTAHWDNDDEHWYSPVDSVTAYEDATHWRMPPPPPPASETEARRAETRRGSVEDEGSVREAQTPHLDPPPMGCGSAMANAAEAARQESAETIARLERELAEARTDVACAHANADAIYARWCALREALEPFAAVARHWEGCTYPDSVEPFAHSSLTYGHFRAAARALSPA